VKILKITSTIPGFREVKFNTTFSVVLGRSKSLHEGKSHNLGKTTLIELIDDILFGSGKSNVIKAIKTHFDKPEFSIDLLADNNVRSFSVDYSKSKKPVFPKDLKLAYEYFIRLQDDYQDEFQKQNIRKKDITWKPLLLKLMGFNESLLIDKYEIEATISSYNNFIEMASASGLRKKNDAANIEKLTQRRDEILKSISNLELTPVEDATSVELANTLDASITDLKKQVFISRKELAAISDALAHNVFVEFSAEKVEAIYADLNVYFGDQLRHDLAEVKDFFNQVTKNRTRALNAMKKKTIDQIGDLERKLSSLTKKRAEYLKVIVSSTCIEIYRDLSTQLSQVESELALLKQDVYRESIQTAKSELSILQTKQLSLAAAVATEIDLNDSKYAAIKAEYSEIMREVMDIEAELHITKNSTGNVSFSTTSSRNGVPSEELKGDMARRISCAAFDVALRIANNEDRGFIIHDGVIDSAGKNITKKFIEAMKRRAIQYDFQYILTSIGDDLSDLVQTGDIVISLTDQTDQELLMGRRF
jgi:uncharacterized protein YydD (DUF2326 family)